MSQHLLPAKPTFGGGGIYHGGGGVAPPNPQIAAYQRTIEQLYEAIARRAEDMIHVDLIANRPTATGSYRFFFATDTDALSFDDGTWHTIGSGGGGSGNVAPAGYITILDYPIAGSDITTALEDAIVDARANDQGVYIPAGSWTVTHAIVWGAGDISSVAQPPPLLGFKRGGFSGTCLSRITGNFNAPIFSAISTDFGGHPLVAGHMENLLVVNEHAGTSAFGVKIENTSQMLFRGCEFLSDNISFQALGENIFPHWDYCSFAGFSQVGQRGINGFMRNARLTNGSVFSHRIGMDIGGDSIYVQSFDNEFCKVAIRTNAMSDLVLDCCHFEQFDCLLTNITSADPPINLTGNYTDAGGTGTGISGAVHFNGCTVQGGAARSNLFVIKGSASFLYGIVVLGGRFIVDNLIATSSFTPASAAFIASGTWMLHLSSAAISYQIDPADQFSNRLTMQANNPINGLKYSSIRLAENGDTYGLDLNSTFTRLKGFSGTELKQTNANTSVFWDGTNLYPSTDANRNLGIAPNNEWLNLRIVNTPVGSSDIRLKQDIAPESLGLEFLLQLNPIQYRLIKDPALRRHGVIAQDLVPLLFPDDSIIVHPESENDYYGVRKGDLVTILVKGMQEQQAQIVALEQRLAALET